INKKDEEFFQRKKVDAEVEEFENVNAKFRPAATKMRKAKLSTSAKDDSIADKGDVIDIESTQASFEDSKPPSSKSIERLANLQGQPQEKIDKLLREIHVLLTRVDQLEEAQRKATSFIKKLRARLSNKEQKISELSKRIQHLERDRVSTRETRKSAEEEKSVNETSIREEKSTSEERSKIEVEKPSDAQIAVALRGLAIMKRNQILEQIVKPKEAKILANFFEAEIPKPNQTVTSIKFKIVMLIDKAFGYGIEVLLMRPDLFEDVVDNELRLFLLDTSKAKRILLDCMLLHPEFVPIAWGGNILTKRQQDRQLQKQMEAKKAAETRSRVENEKLRDTSVPSPSKSFFDFLYNTFGESKEPPKAASPTKPAPNVAEKSVIKKSAESTLKTEKSIVEKPVKSSREGRTEKSVRSESEERPAWVNDRGERVRRRSHKGKAPDKRIGERRRHT
ncbi:hypothetical protein TELCIR_11200, partial [Teladorsagia circumcincta]